MLIKQNKDLEYRINSVIKICEGIKFDDFITELNTCKEIINEISQKALTNSIKENYLVSLF